ncbi:MAG: hypothetical protein HOC71_00990 [Candidatus Latescibacteria bacterium]|jgi:hypothetical protein|nr:hypothetical protein [Candidatus Latescibacterota bacterium]
MKKKKKEEDVIENKEKESKEETTPVKIVSKRSDSEKKEKKGGRKKKSKKSKITEPVDAFQPLEKFGPYCKAFILDHIRTINYIDIANLLNIKADDLKEAIEKMGIKLPIERAHRWSEINVGKFRSLSYCARCQVQKYHNSFNAGINDCRKCYEVNINHWVEKKCPINIKFPYT